jgi:hypothetical protein
MSSVARPFDPAKLVRAAIGVFRGRVATRTVAALVADDLAPDGGPERDAVLAAMSTRLGHVVDDEYVEERARAVETYLRMLAAGHLTAADVAEAARP